MDGVLAGTPGTVSVWCGRLGAARPAYTRLPDVPHYAASTVKVAILAALFRARDAGRIDLDAATPVRNSFPSALPGAGDFSMPVGQSEPWQRVGGTATTRWLAEQMIIWSSNLASNLVLGLVGLAAVAEVWRLVGATRSAVRRPVEDLAARAAGITNEVTAADLAALLEAIATGSVASAASCQEMMTILYAQQHGEDLAAGLPAGTRVAHKNGWITGVRHAAGVVYPDDAPPYTLVVCATTPLARAPAAPVPDEACRLVARVAAASWADRHSLE